MSENLMESLKSLPWLRGQVHEEKSPSFQAEGKLLFLGEGKKPTDEELQSVPSFIKRKGMGFVESWQSFHGCFWLIQPGLYGQNQADSSSTVVKRENHYGLFKTSPYSLARDAVGICFRQILKKGIKTLEVEYRGDNQDEFMGICVGLDMAHYQFKKYWPVEKTSKIKICFKSRLENQEAVIREACCLSEAVNLARFLVDCPANLLQPKAYAQLLKNQFGSFEKCTLHIWDREKLEKEKMGLHLAVGQGSEDGSFMVHLNYNGGGEKPPLAFVGKGIVFDSGGLDLKPGSKMRLMKKDMGGSASVAGLASFVIKSRLPLNCDFYFAIAENSVGSNSFRPGDILTSRSGQTVEIDNTDAEGRLVLADVLTVAVEKNPALLVDIATLTGAIKYGLGLSTPGLFSNDDALVKKLLLSGQAMGETCWRMPLIPGEASRLKSDVADMVNCTDGYGGAVTAALFLEKFVKTIPWAHFDIYSWTNKAGGPFDSSGGTGQMVQTLSHYLRLQ